METINLEKLTTEALESIKGGGWIFQENQLQPAVNYPTVPAPPRN